MISKLHFLSWKSKNRENEREKRPADRGPALGVRIQIINCNLLNGFSLWWSCRKNIPRQLRFKVYCDRLNDFHFGQAIGKIFPIQIFPVKRLSGLSYQKIKSENFFLLDQMWVMIDLIEANVLGGLDDGKVGDSVGDIMLEELVVLENLSDKVLHFPSNVHNCIV